MAASKDIKTVANVLASQANEFMSAEQVAEAAIDALDAARAERPRFFTVAQVIVEGAASRPYVLGPYSTYLKAKQGAERGLAVHQTMDLRRHKYRAMIGLGIDTTNQVARLYDPPDTDQWADLSIKQAKARLDASKEETDDRLFE